MNTYRDDFEQLVKNPPRYPSSIYAGRGIVICGGGRYLPRLWVQLGILREKLNCPLPIQVWHLGREEISPIQQSWLNRFDVEIVDACSILDQYPIPHLRGFELKPYALVHSRFEEVILLDADNCPIRDPQEIFDWPSYIRTGAEFWPGINSLRRTNPIWDLCGVRPKPHLLQVEARRVVVDKRRTWHALQLVRFMNQYSEHYYPHTFGDTNTFFLRWLRLHQPYGMTPHRPTMILPHVLYQKDYDGCILFQHRFGAKWDLKENPHVDQFRYEDRCRTLIYELRQLVMEEDAGRIQ